MFDKTICRLIYVFVYTNGVLCASIKTAIKEILNIRNHGFDFSFAEHVFADPLSVTVYDRYENGEDRWHTLAMVGNTVLVVVHAYPDPDDETWVRVIGLRKATPYERERYEEGHID